jgi:hypothetical protein
MKLSLDVIAKVDMPGMIEADVFVHHNVHVQQLLAPQPPADHVVLPRDQFVDKMRCIQHVEQQQDVKTLVPIQTFQLVPDVLVLLDVFVLVDIFVIVETDVFWEEIAQFPQHVLLQPLAEQLLLAQEMRNTQIATNIVKILVKFLIDKFVTECVDLVVSVLVDWSEILQITDVFLSTAVHHLALQLVQQEQQLYVVQIQLVQGIVSFVNPKIYIVSLK